MIFASELPVFGQPDILMALPTANMADDRAEMDNLCYYGGNVT